MAPADRMKRAPADGSEWSIITLLAIGAFLAGIGWVVGAVLLWRSRVWSVTDKLIGTLLWPGGIVTGLVFAIVLAQAGGGLIAVAVVAVLVPAGSALHLYRRAKQSSTSH
jgi:zinc transporter ZupT